MRRIVVIGGGVTGCSVAFHLAERGLGEVVLVERDRLGSGTTWHSAGNITWKPFGDNDAGILYMLELIGRLERETGLTTGWRRFGRLFLARDAAMLDLFADYHETAASRGLRSRMLDASGAAARHPLLAADAIVGAWLNDLSGRVNPADLVACYARAARGLGVRIAEASPVGEILVRGGRATGVVADGETIACDDVVVCANLWSRDLLGEHGATLAQWGCEHFYIIADVAPRLGPDTPSFISPTDLVYGREEVGGLLLGCFDEAAVPVDTRDLGEPFSFALLNDNWDKFAPYFEAAAMLFPALEAAPVRKFINGPECFTPDGNPLIGRAPGLGGVWLCTAMNSHGVTISGVCGHLVADMLEGVEPRFAAAPYAPARFGDKARDEAWIKAQASAAPSLYYKRANDSAYDAALA
jgi:4-methylaminobutanoate oxidase (formaldehyde-forming)